MSDMSTIAGACREIERALRAARERAYPELTYRAVRQAIDDACERVEQVNLAGGDRCPADVADLIAHLGVLADEPATAPVAARDAHDLLFHLASVLLGWPHDGSAPSARPGGRAA